MDTEDFENEDDSDTVYMTAMELEAMLSHEMFLEYLKAGFSRIDALMLLAFVTKVNFENEEDAEGE